MITYFHGNFAKFTDLFSVIYRPAYNSGTLFLSKMLSNTNNIKEIPSSINLAKGWNNAVPI